ncbi:hypothetical protein BDZ97DRAFT_632600 [Flammula alnicola]|nr:hypothetical protein BDZ97DRAFT_632600 [Flammula alnicola]
MMTLRHDVNGPCSCIKCGGHLPVKLAKGGNSPGQYYIHCISCSYHHTFPKSDIPRAVTALPPPSPSLVHPSAPRYIDCSKPGCKHRGCMQCLRRMCKQCCISLSGCSLRAHNFSQLTLRQRGKLAESSTTAQPNESPLDAFAIAAVENMTAQDPVGFFLEEERQRQAAIHLQNEQAQALEDEEEEQYQAAVAASLSVLHTTPRPISARASSSQPATSFSSVSTAISGPSRISSSPSRPTTSASSVSATFSAPSRLAALPVSRRPTKPSATVRTIPYCPPTITQHMSEDWMRPTVDNTKKSKRVPRVNLDNRFSLVFWHEDEKAPKIRAVHECPLWPKWILMDALDIRTEFDIHATLLEYYDTRSSQWITCTLSYPHDVKKDGSLLLRLLGTSCLGLENHVLQSTSKDTHLRFNMAGERAGVRQQLQKRKTERPPFVVNLCDDEDEVVIVEKGDRPLLKRQIEDDLDLNMRPSQRHCSYLEEHTTPRHPSPSSTSLRYDTPPSFSPFSRSSSITMSPRPASPTPSLEEIYMPATLKPWPAGMYAIDMARAFRLIDKLAEKLDRNKDRIKLDDRLFTVFSKKIPTTTYHDHRRYWKALTENQRADLIQAGHTPDGLWSLVPKVKGSRK